MATCDKCKRTTFWMVNMKHGLDKLKPKLIQLGLYEESYDRITYICGTCFDKINYYEYKCDLCKKPYNICFEKMDKNGNILIEDIKKHHNNKLTEQEAGLKGICRKCLADNKRVKCSVCTKPFPIFQDKSNQYWSTLDRLSPYHNYWMKSIIKGSEKPGNKGYVCLECLEVCENHYAQFSALLRSKIPGTRNDYIKGYNIVKQLGRIEYDGSRYDDPNSLEEQMKIYSAQLGGNSFIKYFWKKEAEKVLAGYGDKGNPYYKTRQYFTGSAIAVSVEPAAQKKPKTTTSINKHMGRNSGFANEAFREAMRNCSDPDALLAAAKQILALQQQIESASTGVSPSTPIKKPKGKASVPRI